MFRQMRKQNKALSRDECIRLLREQKRGVLSVVGDHGYPYGMPMNHWYEESDGCIYFHCGHGGHRLDALEQCGKVSFCVYDEGRAVPGHWALRIRSVIVFGTMQVLDDRAAVEAYAAKLSRKFTSDEAFIREEIRRYAHETLLLKLTPEHISGKVITES